MHEICFTLSLVNSLMGGTDKLRFVSTRLRKSTFFFEACWRIRQQIVEPTGFKLIGNCIRLKLESFCNDCYASVLLCLLFVISKKQSRLGGPD